jgi:outer membrane protein TolC
MLIRLILITIVLSSFTFAKSYRINILVDDISSKYIQDIKKESKALFSSSDKLNFVIKVCNRCKEVKGVRLFKSEEKYSNKSNSSVITYNNISTKYDKNRLVRTVALAIYEFIKEKKTNVLFLKNEIKTNVLKKTDINSTKSLDLKDVFYLAVKNNIQIKQNQNKLKISNLNINEAKSAYKPTIDIYSNYTRIDEDRAKYSNALYSEGTIDANIKLSQLIYSNNVLQNIKIKKLLFRSTKDEIKALDEEIMYKVTLLYLNIIKANKANQIINIKQDFIKQNLKFAKQRVEIGVQDRSDIYRWQSELANVNIDLSNSKNQLNSLKIELSNILQIDSNFDISEYDMNSKLFKLNNKDAIKFIEDKRVQENFSNSIVHSHSRLKQINSLKNIQEQELKMNEESRYMPTVAFQGSAKKVISRYEEGNNTSRLWDDKEYQAVLNINIPLYEGGSKSIKIQKNQIELINLKYEYINIKNLIIENVRKNFESLKRSYEKIKFAKISQNSSKKNLELISAKYKHGKENIISLLDAQDSYIISKLNLNISNIEYLSDLSSIYFFSGNIAILVDKNKKEEIEKNILNTVRGK